MKESENNTKQKVAGEKINKVVEKAEIANSIGLTGSNLASKIYEVRGERVMLDSDLAEIYGYETKYLNRQVKNNMAKFEGDEFVFQLTQEEADRLLRCNFCTSNGNRGGNRYLPYAFTEQGIYMLMTVLRGELAIKQSRALVMMFKQMKDYIIENQGAVDERSQLRMLAQVAQNSQQIAEIREEMNIVEDKLASMADQMSNVVMRSEIAPVLLDFKEIPEKREYLFMNGEPVRAKETYIEIFQQARHSIVVIDNYIDIRTLRMLGQARDNVEIDIFSDNVKHYLHPSDFEDFATEFPSRKLQLYKTCGAVHDRFIIIDRGYSNERVYHCGTSAKDAGKRITTIVELQDKSIRDTLNKAVVELRSTSTQPTP